MSAGGRSGELGPRGSEEPFVVLGEDFDGGGGAAAAGGGGEGLPVQQADEFGPTYEDLAGVAKTGVASFHPLYAYYLSERAYSGKSHEDALKWIDPVDNSKKIDFNKVLSEKIKDDFKRSYEAGDTGRAACRFVNPDTLFSFEGLPIANEIAPDVFISGSGHFKKPEYRAKVKRWLGTASEATPIIIIDCESLSIRFDPENPDKRYNRFFDRVCGTKSVAITDGAPKYGFGKKELQPYVTMYFPAGSSRVFIKEYDKEMVESVPSNRLADALPLLRADSEGQLNVILSMSVEISRLQLANPGAKIIIHCKEGKDRSMMVGALYSVVRETILGRGPKSLQAFVGYLHRVRNRNGLGSDLAMLTHALLPVCPDQAAVYAFSGDTAESNAQKACFGHDASLMFEPGPRFFSAEPNPVFEAGFHFIASRIQSLLALLAAETGEGLGAVADGYNVYLASLEDPYHYPKELLLELLQATNKSLLSMHTHYYLARLSVALDQQVAKMTDHKRAVNAMLKAIGFKSDEEASTAKDKFAGLWEAFRMSYETNFPGRGRHNYVNKNTLIFEGNVAIGSDAKRGLGLGGLPVCVTGRSNFYKRGEGAVSQRQALKSYFKRGVTVVDAIENKSRSSRLHRLVEWAYGYKDEDPLACQGREVSFVMKPVSAEVAEAGTCLYIPKALGLVSSNIGLPNEDADEGANDDPSLAEWAGRANQQLSNFMDLTLEAYERQRKLMVICSEGKDRAFYCSSMYIALEQMIMDSESLKTVGEFVDLIHAVRCNNALNTSLYHPAVLLGYAVDQDASKVETFLRDCGFVGDTKADLLKAAQVDKEGKIEQAFYAGYPIFQAALNKLRGALRQKLVDRVEKWHQKIVAAGKETLFTLEQVGTDPDLARQLFLQLGEINKQKLLERQGDDDFESSDAGDAEFLRGTHEEYLASQAAEAEAGGGGGAGVGADPVEAAADAEQAPRQIRPIIMIDHGGVLDSETRSRNPEAGRAQLMQFYSKIKVNEIIAQKTIQDTDFLLPVSKAAEDIGHGDGVDRNNVPVMPNGPETIRLLNKLVEEHDAILVFHSKNQEGAQMHIVSQLKAAIDEHNTAKHDDLKMPVFTAMAVADSARYSHVTPFKPTVVEDSDHGITVIGFDGSVPDAGKRAVRQALETHFRIKDDERCLHYVLDDGGSNFRAARDEGYQSHRINSDKSTLQALQQIHADLVVKQQQAPRQIEVVAGKAQPAAAAAAVDQERDNHGDDHWVLPCQARVKLLAERGSDKSELLMAFFELVKEPLSNKRVVPWLLQVLDFGYSSEFFENKVMSGCLQEILNRSKHENNDFKTVANLKSKAKKLLAQRRAASSGTGSALAQDRVDLYGPAAETKENGGGGAAASGAADALDSPSAARQLPPAQIHELAPQQRRIWLHRFFEGNDCAFLASDTREQKEARMNILVDFGRDVLIALVERCRPGDLSDYRTEFLEAYKEIRGQSAGERDRATLSVNCFGVRKNVKMRMVEGLLAGRRVVHPNLSDLLYRIDRATHGGVVERISESEYYLPKMGSAGNRGIAMSVFVPRGTRRTTDDGHDPKEGLGR
jgi:hypothetical protein